MTAGPAATRLEPARYTRRGVLGLGVCLLAVAGATVLTPDPDTPPRRYVDVSVGQPADIPPYRLLVRAVRVGRSATTPDGDSPYRSAVRLVAVAVTADVRRQQQLFSDVWLATADGHRYDPRPELSSAGPAPTPPGFSTDFTLLFELPPERVPGAVVVFDGQPDTVDVYRDAVKVRLGLTTATPVATTPLVLPDATVRVTR